MLWSFLYLAFCRSFQLLALCLRLSERKELEILVLRHELAIARRQLGRPRPSAADRALLAGTLREECLDWLPVFGRGQLERVLREHVDHYNRERPHRALGLRAPATPPEVIQLPRGRQAAVRRRDRLGGLIHEYAWAA